MLLSQAEILERIQLYKDLADAMKDFGALEAALPLTPPPTLTVHWDGAAAVAEGAVKGVCIGAWENLRKAALVAARRSLDDAEKRVAEFEAGKEV